MSEMRQIPQSLQEIDSFSRQEYMDAMASSYSMTRPQIAYDLNKRLDQGSIVRIGWGRYSLPKKRMYRHQYSESAIDVVKTISDDYDGLDFQVFELRQLNSFMNHQMAHNTIFVAIENDLVDYVFESLWKTYPGRVMLKPKADQYYRYRQDDEIVVGRLPSETPKGIDYPWMSRLEKILYLADYVEPTRDFDGVEKLRALCFENLDAAMELGLGMSAEEIRARGAEPFRDTLEAYMYYRNLNSHTEEESSC